MSIVHLYLMNVSGWVICFFYHIAAVVRLVWDCSIRIHLPKKTDNISSTGCLGWRLFCHMIDPMLFLCIDKLCLVDRVGSFIWPMLRLLMVYPRMFFPAPIQSVTANLATGMWLMPHSLVSPNTIPREARYMPQQYFLSLLLCWPLNHLTIADAPSPSHTELYGFAQVPLRLCKRGILHYLALLPMFADQNNALIECCSMWLTASILSIIHFSRGFPGLC